MEAASSPPSETVAMFSFESSFDVNIAYDTIRRLQPVAILASVLYVGFIAAGRHYMATRPAMSLRSPLAAWNVALAAFSACGAVRTVPELVRGLRERGLTHNICADMGYLRGELGVWAFVFTLSKLVELGDTTFIVLRKQPLQFLHWYHHVTVLHYCFFSYPLDVASGRWYMVMNYCVHAIMYSFYALKALRVPVPRRVNVIITSLQILQMIVGLAVALGVGALKLGGSTCSQSYANVGVTVAMYVSYFALFIRFFCQAYGGAAAAKGGAPGKEGALLKNGEGDERKAVQNGKGKKAF